MEILREINWISITVRVLLALAIGGILGLERGRRNRPAGFRTYMLVCLGATLVMMTNQYVFETYNVSDPVRLGAQVVSGIGFLGAGTIILTGKSQVRGITTAAGLWTAACCGLAIGIGFYEGALVGGVVIFLVMAVFQRFDVHIRAHAKSIELYLEMDAGVAFSEFIEYAHQHEVDVYNVQVQKKNKLQKDSVASYILNARSRQRLVHSKIIELLHSAPGVHYIEELQ